MSLPVSPNPRLLAVEKISGVTVLDEEHVVLADHLGGVDFASLRGVVVPENLFVGAEEFYGELVGEEDVAVGKQVGVADFAAAGQEIH